MSGYSREERVGISEALENFIDDLYKLFFGPKVSVEEQILFLLQLQMAFRSGVPITVALRSLGSGWLGKMKGFIQRIYRQVYRGKSLSEALASLQIFPPIVISMVKAGEVTGNLERTLYLAYKLLENKKKMTWSIVSSLAYPVVIAFVGIGAIALFNSYFLPTMIDLYTSLGIKLPWLTKALLLMRSLLSVKFMFVFALIASTLTLSYMFLRHVPGVSRVLTRAIVKVPLLGELYRKFLTSYFTRILVVALSSGVPLSETIGLIKDMMPAGLSHVFNSISRDLYEGRSLYQALSKHPWLFPKPLVDVVRVYEESSREEVLEKIADMLEFEYYLTINNLLKVIEPIMMGLMGGLVLFVAAGIFLPMVKLLR